MAASGRRARTEPRVRSVAAEDPAPPRRPTVLSRAAAWLAAIGVAALTWWAYSGAFDHQFVTWDDPAYVWENPLVQRRDSRALLTAVVSANYRPLTMLSLALNARPKLSPEPFIRTNVILHVANTLLVFHLVLLLSSGNLWAALLVALFFGIHPMHVESVA